MTHEGQRTGGRAEEQADQVDLIMLGLQAGREESFGLDRRGAIVRSVAPRRGRPYRHRCQLDTFEAVAHAIDEAGDAGFVLEEVVAAEGLPSSQAATAVAFMKERGCVTTEGRRAYAASGCVHLDAMIEYHAMRREFTGAGRGENG